ncbi:type I restriction endonuclease subunit R [Nonomuraea basaltis]|uniref:type I restriction endonuclease subunit R n=1 Tax=Nonomuraea basaltis TaxID=2495887 RepID=UPI00110C45DB|nr:HsdR family type I site-specific deoxyribonuclease [Nonomuraea basaltis]TMR94755.1 HsdR family type I site-specific deoxyribonuclease [Nonomuraea basaltis]
MASAEFEEVEQPLIEQLRAMEWEVLDGAAPGAIPSVPEPSGRTSFFEVHLDTRLREALKRINPWLDEQRLTQAVNDLIRRNEDSLVEANQTATRLLVEGTRIPDPVTRKERTVHYVDWDEWTNNTFTAVRQFRVDRPTGRGRLFSVPDVTLFINGIAVVVIECKRGDRDTAMVEAIDQLLAYTGKKDSAFTEGIRELFYTNQLLIATHGDRARLGTISSDPDHFAEWKKIHPVPETQVLSELGAGSGHWLTGQEKLAAVVLRPRLLLDILRHFVIFMPAGAGGKRRIKVAPRYQQYRAVTKILDRLRTGRTRRKQGERDERGGIVWHTQGSGKSLTMVFLIRAMRSDPQLRRFKIVIVTDRTDLQDQLHGTALLADEPIQVAKTASGVKSLVRQDDASLVFAMIQKYLRDDNAETVSGSERFADDLDDDEIDFPVLNTSEEILVLIDEAHRSHASVLQARLLASMPNCARIGFTGTPIVSKGKKRTTEIFGRYIDDYGLRDAVADGATVPILYQAKIAVGDVDQAERLDRGFDDLFPQATAEGRQQVQRRHASIRAILESEDEIQNKAADMLRHYVRYVLPGRFKAQVIAASRLAVVRYRAALMDARDDLLARAASVPSSIAHDPNAEIEVETDLLLKVRLHRPVLQRMQFVPVISEGANDPEDWSEWTDKDKQQDHIARFKDEPLPSIAATPWSSEGDDDDEPDEDGGVSHTPWGSDGGPEGPPGGVAAAHDNDEGPSFIGFLIVQSMLLTGFDAPIEQVLYGDRVIRAEELLQAIARPNRPAPGKEVGYFVDYVGVSLHLREALDAYDEEDVDSVLTNAFIDLRSTLPSLADAHRAVQNFFARHGVTSFDGPGQREQAVQVLGDQDLRSEFDELLREFLDPLNSVLPHPKSLQYVEDARNLALIQKLTRRRYRDTRTGDLDPELYGAKIRRLLDKHIKVLGIDQVIPPVEITAPEFLDRVDALPDSQAAAAEMEHALRFHIERHAPEDPIRYQRLSERLGRLLRELETQVDQLALELRALIRDVNRGPQTDDSGLDPRLERPLYEIMAEAMKDQGKALVEQRLQALTRACTRHIAAETSRIDFVHRPYAQDKLRRWLFNTLIDEGVCDLKDAGPVAVRLMQVVRVNASRYSDWERRVR